MPPTRRLRPTSSFAADAVLVGDPGRALLLAQELTVQPKMCNHARGLWGYSGRTAEGDELTVQSTGIGGPSASLVLTELAELGVERVVRVGSCAVPDPAGQLIAVERAVVPALGSASALGLEVGDEVRPDPVLADLVRRALGDAAGPGTVASFDSPPNPAELPQGVDAADMQTVAVLAGARNLGIAAAAILVAVEGAETGIDDELRDDSMRRAGNAAVEALRPST